MALESRKRLASALDTTRFSYYTVRMPEQGSRARRALVDGLSAGRARTGQLRGGNHGLTREQVVESQRERVLGAMREAVAERGFRAVPVAAVIARAGVSRKTFYELYATKEECFAAVYEREMERLTGPVIAAFEGTEAWVDRLRTALGVLLGALASDAGAARICFVEVLTAGPLALERRNAAMAALDPLFDPDGGRDGAAEDPGAAGGGTGRRDSGAGADAAGSSNGGPPPPRSATPISIGYLFEALNREIAAGRAAELPALREQLMRTLTLPFADRAGVRPPHGDAPADGHRPAAAARQAPDAADDAFLTAYGEAAAELLGRVATALAGEAEPAAQVRAGAAAALDFCAERPERARLYFVEALTAGAAARRRRTETGHRLSDLFEQPLRALRPSERIARVSAIALVGGLHELLFDPLDRRAPAALPPVEAILTGAGLDPHAAA